MFASTILTSWAGCPQSRLYHEVVARGDRCAVRMLTRVARQWDHTLSPGWFTRLLPRRLQPAPFDPDEYGVVVAGLSLDTLGATLEQVTWLRGQPAVRASLRSIAFLEAFETAVSRELDAQVRAGRRLRLAASTAAPLRLLPQPRSGSEERPLAGRASP